MGEIKSTLDLVLEKTKHLSQTSEEKQAQKLKDIENRINGLLQKYQDGLLSLGQLQRDYEAQKKEYKLPDHTTLAGQVIIRLDPDLDNRALFEVLAQCCHLDYSGLADIIDEYQAGYQTAAQSRREGLKKRLAQNHFISGSAVIPNLEQDDKWHLEAQELRSRFEAELSRETINLLG